MREIKLRVWDKTYKRFHYMVIDKKEFATTINPNAPVGELSDWELYTGNRDKNRTEIYEGDRIRCYDTGDAPPSIGIIEYQSDGDDGDGYVWSGFFMRTMDIKKIEVIGNIHEKQGVEHWTTVKKRYE